MSQNLTEPSACPVTGGEKFGIETFFWFVHPPSNSCGPLDSFPDTPPDTGHSLMVKGFTLTTTSSGYLEDHPDDFFPFDPTAKRESII